MELYANEHYVLEHLAANLFRGIEAVGGRMSITNERIFFRPHSLNIQAQPLEIRIDDIEAVGKRNTLLLVPNGMLITLKNGQQYKFVIWNRTKVIDMIYKIKNRIR